MKAKMFFVVMMLVLLVGPGCASFLMPNCDSISLTNYSTHMLRVVESGVVVGFVSPGETFNRYPQFLGYTLDMTYSLEVVKHVNGKMTVMGGSDPQHVFLQNGSYHQVHCFVARDDPYRVNQITVVPH
jgi:hypothetical protein